MKLKVIVHEAEEGGIWAEVGRLTSLKYMALDWAVKPLAKLAI